MNILLLEPNKLLGKTYQAALKQAGHTVKLVHTAQAAIHAADGQVPDLIVMEVQLPGHSGIEFLYELRSYPDWQDVPIVLHTLVAEEGLAPHRHHFGRLGVALHLYKPTTDLDRLKDAVNDVFEAPKDGH